MVKPQKPQCTVRAAYTFLALLFNTRGILPNLNKEENKQITWWFDSEKIIYVSMTASFISFSLCQTINVTFNLIYVMNKT